VKILHITSDWKWTGPAEPMLRLLLAQRARGQQAELACPEAPKPAERGIAARAREAGVEPVLELERQRGARPLRDRADVGRLRDLLRGDRRDVLHVWHTRDHLLAWRAAGRGRRAAGPRIVRSFARSEPIVGWPWNRWLVGSASDGILCVSRSAAAASARWSRGRPVATALGAVDMTRFEPKPPDSAVRESLSLASRHRVVGIVARVQRHRRFDLLLEAMRRLASRDPDARLLVIGRGTHLDAVARRPAARLGIADRVILAGYRDADYVDVVRAMDVFTFLVPGSDGSCRALLESHACGIPAVTSRRGALPEIVVDGATGRLVDEDAEALSRAWQDLLRDPVRRAELGRAARQRAERVFTGERLCREVDALYRAASLPKR
jgi:glycosyltransferase involved in cell wall biosynthesis